MAFAMGEGKYCDESSTSKKVCPWDSCKIPKPHWANVAEYNLIPFLRTGSHLCGLNTYKCIHIICYNR